MSGQKASCLYNLGIRSDIYDRWDFLPVYEGTGLKFSQWARRAILGRMTWHFVAVYHYRDEKATEYKHELAYPCQDPSLMATLSRPTVKT